MIVTGAVVWIAQDDPTYVFADIKDHDARTHCIGFVRGTPLEALLMADGCGVELRISCRQTRDGQLATVADDAVVTWRAPRVGETGEYGVTWGPIAAARNVVDMPAPVRHQTALPLAA